MLSRKHAVLKFTPHHTKPSTSNNHSNNNHNNDSNNNTEHHGGTVTLHDTSTNGTFVNSLRVPPAGLLLKYAIYDMIWYDINCFTLFYFIPLFIYLIIIWNFFSWFYSFSCIIFQVYLFFILTLPLLNRDGDIITFGSENSDVVYRFAGLLHYFYIFYLLLI